MVETANLKSSWVGGLLTIISSLPISDDVLLAISQLSWTVPIIRLCSQLLAKLVMG